MSNADLRGRLISKQDAGRYCAASTSWVDRLIRDGKVSVVRISPKMTRVVGDSLADFLEQQATVPSTPRGKAAINAKGAV